MDSLTFQDSDPLKDSSLKVSLSILFSQPEILTSLSNYHLCSLHPSACIISQTILLARSHSNIQPLNLTQLITSLSKGTNQDLSGVGPDPIDTLSSILVNFHCYSITGRCSNNEETAKKSCSGQCILHKFLFLGVAESMSCKCGRKWENLWDYTNICQFFHISGLFENFEEEPSQTISTLPKYRFKNSQLSGNSKIFQKKLFTILSSKLKNAVYNSCIVETCPFPEVSIKFTVNHAPDLYIVSIVYESHNLRHLESYLCTISIQSTFMLNDLYHEAQPVAYGLLGVIFYGKGLVYAKFNNGHWVLPGLHDEAGWYELVQEALIMNLHPVALVYRKGEVGVELELDSYKLLRMEQSAVQCDLFLKHYGNSIVPEGFLSSGLFVEKRSGIKIVGNEGVNARVEDQKNKEIEVAMQQAGWKCECGAFNLEDFEVCTLCSQLKPGVSGWVCKSCFLRNEEFSSICNACFEYKDPELLSGYKKEKWTSELASFKDKPEKVIEKKDGLWKCDCQEWNSDDFEVCQKCYMLLPGVQGWVCKACKCKNEETEILCSLYSNTYKS